MAFRPLLPFALIAPIFHLAICAPNAPTIDWEDDGDGSFFVLPVIHGTNEAKFGKRAIEAQLANRSDVAYYVSLDIGNPPQQNFVQLDTGSFELWVNPVCDNLDARGDRRFCSAVGSYDPAQSSTSSFVGENNTLRYGIGSADIEYVRDDIALTGSRSVLTQVQFGSATSTEDEFAGILGIGYGQNITMKYPNFIDELDIQGITKRKAFSVGLGSKDEQEGAILFGGVDTSKYSGALAQLPIVPAEDSPDGVPRYWVKMNSLSLTPPSQNQRTYENTTTPVFLDTGATLTLLPPDLANAIAADFGSDGVEDNGFYQIGCDLYDMAGTLDFEFDGVIIRIPYREMIRMQMTSPPRCYLGIVPSNDFLLLGDTFLRSAYVVFDLEDDNVYMAQYVNCGSSPQGLTSDTDFSTLIGSCASSDPTTVEGSATGSDSTENGGTSTSDGVATVTITETPASSNARPLVSTLNLVGRSLSLALAVISILVAI